MDGVGAISRQVALGCIIRKKTVHAVKNKPVSSVPHFLSVPASVLTSSFYLDLLACVNDRL